MGSVEEMLRHFDALDETSATKDELADERSAREDLSESLDTLASAVSRDTTDLRAADADLDKRIKQNTADIAATGSDVAAS
jgi:hypothetical protein